MIRILMLALLLLPSYAFGQIEWVEHTIGNSFDAAHTAIATDMNNDGDMDVLGAAVGSSDVSIWENDGEMNWELNTITGRLYGARSVYPADLDQDGDLDVVAGGQIDDAILWWPNDGEAGFPWTGTTITDEFDGVKSVFAVDMDLDGDMDIVGAAAGSVPDYIGAVRWWENTEGQQFIEHSIDEEINGAHRVYALDMDGDSDVDVVSCARNSDEIVWYENNGVQVFIEHQVDGVFAGARSIYPVDLDGDGDMDIIGCGQYQDECAWWENTGNMLFAKHSIDDDMDGARDVFAGDMNADGYIDVLCAEYIPGRMVYFQNDGNQQFTRYWISEYWDGARAIRAVDMDLDGDLDVLGAAGFADAITWWENNGTLGVTEGPVPAAQLPSSVILSDAYPNPFNGSCAVTVELDHPGQLTLRATDLLGRQVARVSGQSLSAGQHTLTFDGADLASGVYFLRAGLDGELSLPRKIVLMK